MGNCIETCKSSPQEKTLNSPSYEEEMKASEKGNGDERNRGKNNTNMRIKIVLTKEELEWLLKQLKNTEGKRVEDVLKEIQRSREKPVLGSWKPSLDSITEIPEVPESMER